MEHEHEWERYRVVVSDETGVFVVSASEVRYRCSGCGEPGYVIPVEAAA